MDADVGLIAKWADKLSVSAAFVSAGATSRSTDVMLKGGGAGGGGGAVGGVGAMITGGAPLLCAESLPHALKENTIPSANKLNFGFPILHLLRADQLRLNNSWLVSGKIIDTMQLNEYAPQSDARAMSF
ncbi:hypothetical protein [Sphingorhabdus sp.]|jgi:hypothetical protein|uniref:hypothetical protein n=1 Tax=Sphingorhabdus sp. TaxID=1902408 RepID=UPI002FDB68F2|nr:hypothetical protein [Sphingomonadaceae bacterium]